MNTFRVLNYSTICYIFICIPLLNSCIITSGVPNKRVKLMSTRGTLRVNSFVCTHDKGGNRRKRKRK